MSSDPMHSDFFAYVHMSRHRGAAPQALRRPPACNARAKKQTPFLVLSSHVVKIYPPPQKSFRNPAAHPYILRLSWVIMPCHGLRKLLVGTSCSVLGRGATCRRPSFLQMAVKTGPFLGPF